MKFTRLAPPNRKTRRGAKKEKKKERRKSSLFKLCLVISLRYSKLSLESKLNYVTCVITLKSAIAL